MLNILNRKKSVGNSLAEIVQAVKRDKHGERNRFIADYKPFVIRVLVNLLGYKTNIQGTDEFSIALMAFNEAIECYDEDKGNFFSFASMVIKRRVYNYITSTSKHIQSAVFLSDLELENCSDINNKHHALYSEDLFNFIEIQEQLSRFEEALHQYGSSLDILALESPKHEDSRIQLIETAKMLLENPKLFKTFLDKKRLPISKLSKFVHCDRKTISRNKHFITAVVLILSGEFDYLKNYIITNERTQIK
ncbi:MAG: hypothetical protein N2645_23755 [Clostridia bacterium]|nr:hypothetical protein [Clostridia bacterium]